ncbi:MAG TPA: cobalamin-dependent protein, partial [bacterium]|nr:cobalamin-dependent protein [bacterium]
KILLATVRGDIHDIGKNIVKVLLENYGFQVVDLGKDVPEQEIVQQVKEKKISLVGLSALMTTTVRSMESTIKALRAENLPCQVMVGGAVLNEEYARLIGADYYGRDARAAVAIARQLVGGEDMDL